MKAISLWQPWASLVAVGAKKIETRSWHTAYRGLLAIHATKKYTKEMRQLEKREPFYSALRQPFGNYCYPSFSCGCIVAVVNLDGCWIVKEGGYLPSGILVTDKEKAFGDYRENRFMWPMTLITRLKTPIPFKGHQGFFEVPDELIKEYL